MGVTSKSLGDAAAAGAAGTIIGQSQKRETESQMMAAQAAQERAMAFELEKMEMRSRQDFEQELRMRQFDYEKFNRAKEWEMEKMEIASRLDFEREEKDRQRKIDNADNAIEAIQKKITAGEYSADDKRIQNFLLYYEMEKLGADAPTPTSFIQPPRSTQDDSLTNMINSLTGADTENVAPMNSAGTTETPDPFQPITAVNDETGERMISRDGGKTWEPPSSGLREGPLHVTEKVDWKQAREAWKLKQRAIMTERAAANKQEPDWRKRMQRSMLRR